MTLSFQVIMQTVAQHYQLTVAQLTGNRRMRAQTQPRQIAMYLCREMLPRLVGSFSEIGQRFNKDHTTAVHACRNIRRMCDESMDFAKEVARLRNTILSMTGADPTLLVSDTHEMSAYQEFTLARAELNAIMSELELHRQAIPQLEKKLTVAEKRVEKARKNLHEKALAA